jgi:hypothetical protein
MMWRKNFEECGLAGAVVAEDADNGAGRHGEGHRIKGGQ